MPLSNSRGGATMGIHGRRLMILLAVSMPAALYSAWTLYGAGSEAFWWGMALFALGLPHEIPTCRNERCGAGTFGVG